MIKKIASQDLLLIFGAYIDKVNSINFEKLEILMQKLIPEAQNDLSRKVDY